MVKVARLIGLVPWVLDVDKVADETYRDTAGPGTNHFSEVMNELEKRTDDIGIRDRALLALLHDAGLRRDEAHSLDLEHVDFQNHRVWVKAKKRTSRVEIPINPEVERCLRDWIKVRGTVPGALFKNFDLDKKGDRLSGNGIARVSHKYGLGHPHGLRHLAITEALEVSGGNITEVMKFSRHKDPKTVMIYDDKRKNVSGVLSAKIAQLRKNQSPNL
jgi:integrase/recombinase XerC